MMDLIQQISTIFSRVSSEPTANWAEDFARNRLIPILEHLPFVPAGVAEHFPVSLGTILVMFGACGIFVAIVPLIPLVLVLAERKVSAQIQNRTGPMRVGPWGTLQTLADGVKLIFKEDFIPPQGDKLLFVLAPYIIFACSFAAFAAIPFGQGILISDFNIGISILWRSRRSSSWASLWRAGRPTANGRSWERSDPPRKSSVTKSRWGFPFW